MTNLDIRKFGSLDDHLLVSHPERTHPASFPIQIDWHKSQPDELCLLSVDEVLLHVDHCLAAVAYVRDQRGNT